MPTSGRVASNARPAATDWAARGPARCATQPPSGGAALPAIAKASTHSDVTCAAAASAGTPSRSASSTQSGDAAAKTRPMAA